MKKEKLDLVTVLRNHARLLRHPDIKVNRKNTAKLLTAAAKLIEMLRGLKWGGNRD